MNITTCQPALETYEELVTAGQALVSAMDKDRWQLGDLANELTSRLTGRPPADFAGKTLASFASDIGASAKTLGEYARLAAFYPPEVRSLYPTMTHTYYRTAYSVSGNNLETALEWLRAANDNSWSADKIRLVANTVKKPGERPAVTTHDYRGLKPVDLPNRVFGDLRFDQAYDWHVVRHAGGRVIMHGYPVNAE